MSMPPQKRRKVSEATIEATTDVPKREPVPSADITTIRGVAEEWFNPHPPHCSLRDMMKGEGPAFDAWRKDHKSRCDHRKNLWWAIHVGVKDLADGSRNDQLIVDEVIQRLESEKKKLGGTLDQFIKSLPTPPPRVWRYQL